MYYICDKCNCKCATKLIFDKHIITKKHLRNIQEKPIVYDCSICSKSYKLKANYDKHMALCSEKIKSGLHAAGIPEAQVSNVLATLNPNTTIAIPSTGNNIQNITTQNNIATQNNQNAETINNITQNIYITPFGKEDISMISQEMRREIIGHEKRAYEYLIKEMYNNKTNHNVFISDKRNKLVKYLKEDKTLEVAQLCDALKEMIKNHKKILNDFIDTFSESFKGGVPGRLQELKDDHETDDRDDKYIIISKKKLYEISESAKAQIKKM